MQKRKRKRKGKKHSLSHVQAFAGQYAGVPAEATLKI